jgi:predicted RNase H-like nuclease (RuvC/YqgF family)
VRLALALFKDADGRAKELTKKVEGQEDIINRLTSQCQTLEGERASLEGDIELKDLEIQDLKDKITNLNTELAEARKLKVPELADDVQKELGAALLASRQ